MQRYLTEHVAKQDVSLAADLNGDGKITITDVTALQKQLAEITE